MTSLNNRNRLRWITASLVLFGGQKGLLVSAADNANGLRGTTNDNDDNQARDLLAGDLFRSPLFYKVQNLGAVSITTPTTTAEENRIVGGGPASPGTDSYYVMTLTSSGTFRGCGASLISNCHALCAAHCGQISRVFVGAYEFESGTTRPSTSHGNYFETNIIETIIHPDYNDATTEGDLSILVFDTCMTEAQMASLPPALLPDSNFQYIEEEQTDILGFGRTSEDDTKNSAGQYVQVLQKVQTNFFSYDTCRSYMGGSLKPDMVCAGDIDGGKDACIGDSGGPAAVWRNGLPYVVGVTSWGIGCARKNYPGVYASTRFHHDWIQNIVCFQDIRTITSLLELCGGSRVKEQISGDTGFNNCLTEGEVCLLGSECCSQSCESPRTGGDPTAPRTCKAVSSAAVPGTDDHGRGHSGGRGGGMGGGGGSGRVDSLLVGVP